VGLNDLVEDYSEEPFFLRFQVEGGYLFHCNFENVDEERFPTHDQSIKGQRAEREVKDGE
jgi:hypothetical protein